MNDMMSALNKKLLARKKMADSGDVCLYILVIVEHWLRLLYFECFLDKKIKSYSAVAFWPLKYIQQLTTDNTSNNIYIMTIIIFPRLGLILSKLFLQRKL